MYQMKIIQGTLLVSITANDTTGPFHCRLYVNNGETATFLTRTAKTLVGAERAAAKLFALHTTQ